MCGRVTLTDPSRVFAEFSVTGQVPEFTLGPRYNIAPSQSVPVIRARPSDARDAPILIEMVSWGLIPSWTQDVARAHKQINVRIETARDKPGLRSAVSKRRCLVITDGFYEWKREGRSRQAFHIRRRDGGALTMAGLWDRWLSPDGQVIETCAVVTMPALPPVVAIHDRMPAIVGEQCRSTWLDAEITDHQRLLELLVASASGQSPGTELVMVEVGTTVHSASSEGPRCLAPPTQVQGNLFSIIRGD